MLVAFTIPGVPQQQGSKQFSKNGYGYEANKKLKPWRADALTFARDARPTRADDGPVFTGPVQVTVICYFPRPASHYGTGRNARQLKPSAPFWHATAPDLDKCCRALGDVLTQSQLVLDDRLIVAWDASKVYGDPRMDVTITDAGQLLVDQVIDQAVSIEQDSLLEEFPGEWPATDSAGMYRSARYPGRAG